MRTMFFLIGMGVGLLLLAVACRASSLPGEMSLPTPTATLENHSTPTPTSQTYSGSTIEIVPGVFLSKYPNSNGADLYTMGGQMTFYGDGTINHCYFHTQEGRQHLEETLSDADAMRRIQEQLERWGLVGKPLGLPMALGMDAPDNVQTGESATLKVTIYSNSDCPVEYPIGDPAFDIVVSRFDGTEVWRWSEGQKTGLGGTLRLGSREERAFEAIWDLHDRKRNPLPEGAYWVDSYLNLGMYKGTTPEMYHVNRQLMFIGSPQPLTRWLNVWLEMPAEVRLGEPVPLTLKVRNISEEPVNLFHGISPFDFTILEEDGTEIWRWSRWRVFADVLIHSKIQPGETLEYHATWDGHDQDCRPEPGVYGMPCQGSLVTPGRYTVRSTFEAALSDDHAKYSETLEAQSQEMQIR